MALSHLGAHRGERRGRSPHKALRTVFHRWLLVQSVLLSTSCVAQLTEDPGTQDADSQVQGSQAPDGSGGFVDPGPPPTQDELPQVGTIDYPTASGVIDNNCTLSKCHGRDEEPLITVDAAFPAFLLNTLVEECGNVPLVTPGDPSKSALLLLVTRQCGELVMPDKCRTNPCLTDKDYATLLAWVQQGAPMQ